MRYVLSVPHNLLGSRRFHFGSMHHYSAINNSIIHCFDLTQGQLHKIDFTLDGDDVETIFLRVTGNCTSPVRLFPRVPIIWDGVVGRDIGFISTLYGVDTFGRLTYSK